MKRSGEKVPNTKTEISVVIPNWNGHRFLETCLKSLLRQTFRNFEIIVVDNGSEDHSISFIKNTFSTVRVIAFPENRGFSVAVNEGIRASRGKYAALLNNDTEVDPRWLENLYRVMEENPRVGLCASKILQFDDRRTLHSAGDMYRPWTSPKSIGQGRVDNGQYNTQRSVFGACAAAAMYRRSMLDEIGLFDEDFFAYCEDFDLSFRAQIMGYSCLYVPEAVVYHVHHGSSRNGRGDGVIFYVQRNMVSMILKNMPSSLLIKYWPLLVGLQIYSVVKYVLRGKTKTVMAAKRSAFEQLPRILRKRKSIQRSKRVSDGYIDHLLRGKN